MSAALELILIGLDCFSFVLEPFVRGILAKLNLAKIDQRRRRALLEVAYYYRALGGLFRWPWFNAKHHNHEQQRRQSKRQDQHEKIHLADEINEFCGQAALWRVDNERLLLLEETKQTIKAKWSWLLLHAAMSDPAQLDWLDYDLGLVADWDFPELAPKLDTALNSVWRPTGYPALLLNREELTLNPTSSETTTTRALIHPSSVNRKLLVEVRRSELQLADGSDNVIQQEIKQQARQQQQQDQQLKQHNGARINLFLHVKWITIDEFQLYTERSSLVFYYTQVYPQLSALYLIVSSLFEEAHLIESSSSFSSFSSSSASFNFRRPSLNNRARLLDCCSSAQEPNYLGRSRDADNEQQRGQQLNRYALVLILAAYLAAADKSKDQRRRPANVGGGGGESLLRSLVGFFRALGKPLTAGWRMSVRQSGSVRQWKEGCRLLEMSATQCARPQHQSVTKAKARPPGCLVVLDPVLTLRHCRLSGYPDLEGHESNPLADAGASSANKPVDELDFPSSANLTESLSWPSSDLGRLLERLAAYAELEDGEEEEEHALRSERPISGLFTLCADYHQHALESPANQNAAAKQSNNSKLEAKLKRIELTKISDHVKESLDEISDIKQPSSKVSKDKTYPKQGWFTILLHEPINRILLQSSQIRRRAPRKVLTNILYIALFLLVRNLLLNHLEQMRSDLKDQARDDLVDLKHSIFQTSTKPVALSDHLDSKDKFAGFDSSVEILSRQDSDNNYYSKGKQDAALGRSDPASSSINEPASQAGDQTDQLMGDLYAMLLMQALSGQVGLDLQELIPLLTGDEKMGQDEQLAGDQKTKISQLLSQLDGELGSFRSLASRHEVDYKPKKRREGYESEPETNDNKPNIEL